MFPNPCGEDCLFAEGITTAWPCCLPRNNVPRTTHSGLLSRLFEILSPQAKTRRRLKVEASREKWFDPNI